MNSIIDIIRIPFGFVIKLAYSLTGSYFLALLIFSIILKIVLFPLGIKQQKNSQKQAKLRPKENVIRKKYAGRTDRQTQLKMNTEIQELYQKENFSPLSGCLPLIIQLAVLLIVYAVVRMPITYTASTPSVDGLNTAELVEIMERSAAEAIHDDLEDGGNGYGYKISQFLNISDYPAKDTADFEETLKKYNDKYDEALEEKSFTYYAEIKSGEFGRKNPEIFKQKLIEMSGGKIDAAKADEIVENLPDLTFLGGLNLGDEPALSSLTSSEASLSDKLLLLIPLFTLISSYVGQAITKKFTYQPETAKEQQSQARIMSIFMPLISVFISFRVPAALAVYWIISNLLSPVQQIALSKMFKIPTFTEEELREAERLYGGKSSAKKKNKALSDGKKKKSLVYDDDDEYISVTRLDEETEISEKDEETAESIVDKAPLKDSSEKKKKKK